MSEHTKIELKFRRHETFHIRKGWISKGLFAVREKADIFIDKKNNPMDELGIGSNMVKSLRYWLQAVRVTEEPSKGKRIQTLTNLGELIMLSDPYLEELESLWILHYELVNNQEMATSWYYMFNEFNLTNFTEEDFTKALSSYAARFGQEKALGSYADDFNCILRTYLPKGRLQATTVSPENNIDCPFLELGLLEIDDIKSGIYRKKKADPDLLPELVVLYALLRYREQHESDSKELRLENVLNRPGSPGRAFNLDSLTLLEVMRKLDRRGYIRVVRTAGLDTLRIDTEMSADECLRECFLEVM